MAYQTKIRSNEASPWIYNDSAKKLVSFNINAGSGRVLQTMPSFLELKMLITTSVYDPYSGVLRWASANDKYHSGPACLIKHCWIEGDKIGKIESKRYANIINEHLAEYRHSHGQDSAGNVMGSTQELLVEDGYTTVIVPMAQISNLFSQVPEIDLDYTGDMRVTLEFDVAGLRVAYDANDVPKAGFVACANITPTAPVTILTTSNPTDSLQVGLSFNQQYELSYDHGGAKLHAITVIGLSQNGTETDITIDPAINDNGAWTNIQIRAIGGNAVTRWQIDEANLVVYKPIVGAKPNVPKSFEFDEWVAVADSQPATTSYNRQWNLEPLCKKAYLLLPADSEIVSDKTNVSSYRGVLNGIDTVDREIVPNSALYMDRAIASIDGLKNLNPANSYHIGERIPVNGLENTLQTNVEYSVAPAAKTAYLFKQIPKRV